MDPTVPSYFVTINFAAQGALLVTLGVGFWIAVRRSALGEGERSTTFFAVAGTVLIWFAGALWLSRSGAYLNTSAAVPPIVLAIILPIAIGLYVLTSSRHFQSVFDVIPQSWLTGVQIYRVLGAMFLALWAQGRMPGEFALPAGIGDVVVGATAPVVAWLNATRSPSAPSATLAWNILGIGDLIVAVGTGFLTSPTPYQLLAIDRPNLLISDYPFVLVPTFFVPLSIILHALSLRTLVREGGSFPAFA